MKGLPRSLSRGSPQLRNMIKRTIPLDGVTVTVTSTGAAIGFGSVAIEGLPEGNILVQGLAASIGLAGSGADANLADTWNGDFAIGTTPVDDATMTAGDVDLAASVAAGPATAEVVAAQRVVGVVSTMFDNTAADLEINLNVLVDAADIVDDQSVVLTLSGYVSIAYIVLGDD